MLTAWTKFRSALRAFRVAHSGNVAVTFAVAVIPVVGCVGTAVDYSHANAVKVALQAALDSTSLMLSKEAPGLSSTDLQIKAKTYFLALFTRPEAKDITVSATYNSTAGSALVVNASADVPTAFLGVLGKDKITVNSTATAKWGNSRLRVALVLDNTGSMSSNDKIGALKTATNNLLTQLKDSASVPEDVYVSIVPFVKDVKIDPTGYSVAWDAWLGWDDGTDKSWDGANGTCSIGNKSPRSVCLAQTQCSLANFTNQNSCTSGGICSIVTLTSQNSCTTTTGCTNPNQTTQNSCTNNKDCNNPAYSSKNSCENNGGTWAKGTWGKGTWTAGVWTQANWTPNSHTTWNGCITDRGTAAAPGTSAGYDQDVTQPTTAIAATLFPVEQYSSCPQPMMGLNNNWTSMTSLVNSMTPAGNTNQGIGLVWGWQTLVGGGPFSAPSMDSNYEYQQIIILLSDGMNTENRWYTSQTSIDKRMYDSTTGKGTCANIKAAGVTVYSIQVNTGNDPTSTIMQNCASNTAGTTDHFFLLTSADQIVTTFQKIGTSLTKLRVAK